MTELTTYGELAEMLAQLPVIVRSTRRSRRLSIRESGRAIGVSFSTVSRVENGELPDSRSLLLILRWLDAEAEPEASR